MSKPTAEQRAAVELIFGRLPRFMQTRSIRNEMARSVARSADDHEAAAVECALRAYDRLEKEGRVKLFEDGEQTRTTARSERGADKSV